MKALDELRNEIMADEELKQAFTEALLNGTAAEFAAARGVDATPEEIKAALDEFVAQIEGELSDAQMSDVAGGFSLTVTCPYCGGTRTSLRDRFPYFDCFDCKKGFIYK